MTDLTELTKLIKQRTSRDCYLCCIAMATSSSYESLAESLTPSEVADMELRGTFGKLIDKLWSVVGYSRKEVISIYCKSIRPDITRGFLFGRRALIQVPSLNYTGEQHIVYWDGHQLFDPSNLKTYDDWQTLPLDNFVTILDEQF